MTPTLRQLRWLPVRRRVGFKMASLVYQVLSSKVPSYLADDIHLASKVLLAPSGPLHGESALSLVFTVVLVTDVLLQLDHVSGTTYLSVCETRKSAAFRRQLKTFMFQTDSTVIFFLLRLINTLTYLLTYLLAYLLTYLLQYAPVVIMSEVHKRNQYRPLPAVDSVRSFSSVCSHQLTLARKVLRKRCISHTNRVLKNFLRTAQHLPVPPARTPPISAPAYSSPPFPSQGGHPLYPARGPGERCRLSQRVRPPNDYCCTWS